MITLNGPPLGEMKLLQLMRFHYKTLKLSLHSGKGDIPIVNKFNEGFQVTVKSL